MEFSFQNIFLTLIQDAGLFALVFTAYTQLDLLLKNISSAGRQLFLGILFGLGAVSAMIVPIQLAPGYFFDMRTVMVALAGPFGGPIGGAAAAVVATCYRFQFGGDGAFAGAFGINLAALIGIGVSCFVRRQRREVEYRDILVILGLLIVQAVLIFKLVPWHSDVGARLNAVFAPFLVALTIAVLFMGSLLIEARRRAAVDTRLKDSEARLRDHVGELAALAEDLAHQKHLAEQASAAKSAFLANMSHELRTPLNAVIGFSEIIRRQSLGPVGTPKYAEFAGAIHDSGQHLLDLINDILDLSKVEAGRLEIKEEAVDVQAVITKCARLFKTRADQSGILLVVEFEPDLPFLFCDERRFKQILLNLLSNGLKFTPKGGRVTITAGVEPSGDFTIAVSDTGVGISEADRARVMEVFVQVDSGLNRRLDGTGLGLPLTKRLVELHGGKVSLESELGVGTTVTARFPGSRIRRATSASDLVASA